MIHVSNQMTKTMPRVRYFLTFAIIFLMNVEGTTQFSLPGDNKTPTWQECIDFYNTLDKLYVQAGLIQVGSTDIGKPLHLFVINSDQVFYPELLNRNKTILLINNAIHPGEPDGVNASMMLAQQLLDGSPASNEILKNMVVCIVPMYNVDGALNRTAYSRANQDGPAEYGFRGNAKNLDLNRDFIKCDSKNAASFNRMFTRLKPHVMVDTHVSNGADYPYTMTLITTQTDKLGGSLGKYVKEKFEPALFKAMEDAGDKMCPYVNTMGRTPETGLIDFFESPRFATGYGALHHCIGFTSETHMLKPFNKRVASTYLFLKVMLNYVHENHDDILNIYSIAQNETLSMKKIPIGFELDTAAIDRFRFDGYESVEEKSQVSQGKRLRYDQQKPWTKDVKWFRKYKVLKEVEIPQSYIIPQAWSSVIDRLVLNGVELIRLEKDTIIEVNAYRITGYESPKQPYEGHYLHAEVTTEVVRIKRVFYAGDVLVKTNQPARRYICHVLEPECEDSFFAWNFFDSILQQKEWFSDYVFEDIAADLLKNDLSLKKSFEAACAKDPELKNNNWASLYWIYQHSPYYEKTVSLYPVFMLMN